MELKKQGTSGAASKKAGLWMGIFSLKAKERQAKALA